MMKWKMEKILIGEAMIGVFLAVLCQKVFRFSNALEIEYLPFEVVGKILRWMSLGSDVGNVIAIIIYIGICIWPVFYYWRKHNKGKEDILLFLISLFLFYIIYEFINPGRMYHHMPDIFTTDSSAFPAIKIGYANLFYSLLIAWGVLKAVVLLGKEEQKGWKKRLYRGMNFLLILVASFYTLMIFYVKIFEILQKASQFTMDDWMKMAVQILPICLMIWLLLTMLNMVKAMESENEEKQMKVARKLSESAKLIMGLTVLVNVVFNIYQFVASANLQHVNFNLDLSIQPLLIAFGSLIFYEYFKKTKKLKEENDQFI